MTTIATDGKTIAADGRMVMGDHIVREDVDKIYTVTIHGKKLMVGFAGAFAFQDEILDFVRKAYLETHEIFSNARFLVEPEENETEYHTPEDTSALILTPNGGVWLITYGEPAIKMGRMYAIGSGADYALGALYAGKSPGEAVLIASKLDCNTNGNVTIKTHG